MAVPQLGYVSIFMQVVQQQTGVALSLPGGCQIGSSYDAETPNDIH
jgi:hypothetical protein